MIQLLYGQYRGKSYYDFMNKIFENTKLDYCKDELKILLQKLVDGNYHKTAEVVFSHIAHTGVESDLNPTLKDKPTFEEFISSK